MPQRTTKEHKTGPQRIGNHEKTARLATILFNLKKLFCLFFVIFYFFGVFVNFGVFDELWRFTKRLFWDPCTFVKGWQHNFHGTANFMYCRSTPKIRYLMHAVARQSEVDYCADLQRSRNENAWDCHSVKGAISTACSGSGKGLNLPAPLDIQWQKCFHLQGAVDVDCCVPATRSHASENTACLTPWPWALPLDPAGGSALRPPL